MTRVLPEPAPARTSCGPSPWVTAAICSGLSLDSISWETDFFTPAVCPRGEGKARRLLRFRRSTQDLADRPDHQGRQIPLAESHRNFTREIGIAAGDGLRFFPQLSVLFVCC